MAELPTEKLGEQTPSKAMEMVGSLVNRATTQTQNEAQDYYPEFINPANVFSDLQREDITWKVTARKRYGFAMVVLLFLQNFVVFTILLYALFTGQLPELQVIFGIIVPATLGETAFMVKIIIEWLFRDIDYPYPDS